MDIESRPEGIGNDDEKEREFPTSEELSRPRGAELQPPDIEQESSPQVLEQEQIKPDETEVTPRDVEAEEVNKMELKRAFDEDPDNYAVLRISEFKNSVDRFLDKHEDDIKPAEGSLVGNVTRNFSRAIEDWGKRRERRKNPLTQEQLQQVRVEIKVLERNAFLDDPAMEGLMDIPGNSDVIMDFMQQELYKEINSTHWLAVQVDAPEGIEIEGEQLLHHVVESLGYNPAAFFSDDRKENAGRIAIDNAPERMPVDETDPNYEEEKKYWKPVFTRLSRIPLIRNLVGDFMESRLHSVVYKIEDESGQDIMMLPVHVDPKNWVVSIREIPQIVKSKLGFKTEERTALDYHKIADLEGEMYTGTGLYDLGNELLIDLLQEASLRGDIGEVSVDGREKLITTGTISGDEKRSVAIEQAYREQVKGKED